MVTWGFKLDQKGVDIYKEVKGGFSTPARYQFPNFLNMIVSSFTIMIVGFIMTIVCAKKLAEKNGYQVSGNRELVFLSYSYSFIFYFFFFTRERKEKEKRKRKRKRKEKEKKRKN